MKSLFLQEEKFYLQKLLSSECLKVYNLISTALFSNTTYYFTKRYDFSNNSGTVISLFCSTEYCSAHYNFHANW